MKRAVDEGQKTSTSQIKVPEVPNSKTPAQSAVLSRIEMPQQPVANAAAAAGATTAAPATAPTALATNTAAVTIAAAHGSFPRIQTGSSVSVFRGGAESSQPTPPAAHSGVALTAPSVRSSTQPAPPAHIPQAQQTTVVAQPQTNIKPETIGEYSK